MRPDVSSLKLFYNSPVGRGAAYCLGQKLLSHWGYIANMDVMGLGFAGPVLDNLMSSGAEMFALMPGGQGAVVWPDENHGRSILVDEYHLPFDDGIVDRLILLHALEYAHKPALMLRECWRVLKPGGRLIVITPNRRRTWSTFDHTPFGHGTPYSKGQLVRQLEEQLLFPTYISSALMMPPLKLPGIERMIKMGEMGLRGSFEMLGGLLFVEAEKRVYGALLPAGSERRGVRVLSSV